MLIKGPLGIMFHHFHKKNQMPEGQGSITSEELVIIIKFLKKKYNILSPKEWTQKILNKKIKKKDICITFDDALLSQYKIALNVLENQKIKAFWFVYSSVFKNNTELFEIHRKFRTLYFRDFEHFFNLFLITANKVNFFIKNTKYKKYYNVIKKKFPMYSSQDIKFRYLRDKIYSNKEYNFIMKKLIELKKTSIVKLKNKLWMQDYHLRKLHKLGHVIGLHGYNHIYNFNKLSYQSQYTQIKKNYDHLNKTLKFQPYCMSYPNGLFNKNTLRVLKKFKIKFSFLSNLKNKSYGKFYDNFLIKRLDHALLLKKLKN